MIIFRYLVVICAYGWVSVANAEDLSWRAISPDYLKVQAAGNIGLLAIGAGKQLSKHRIDADVWYGFVPAAQGGIDIHTIAIKGHMRFWERPYGRLYVGSTLLHVLGKQYYAARFEKGDRDYYPWTSVHLMPYLGGSYEVKGTHGRVRGIYIEMGVLDTYAFQYVQNLKSMRASEIYNLAVGIIHHF